MQSGRRNFRDLGWHLYAGDFYSFTRVRSAKNIWFIAESTLEAFPKAITGHLQ